MNSGKIRVLIVDDVAETRENVRKLLQFENDMEIVGAARSGKEGIQLTQELDPDVVLMDINMPDMDGIAATEVIRQKKPYIQVVILSVQGDQNYMRRAMLAGARDFLIKPPHPDELISALRQAGELARAERARVEALRAPVTGPGTGGSMAAPGLPGVRGKVIVVYSPKGGTGCTTVAVNLALALHNDDTPAVIVDSNLQYGDVAVFFNEQGKANLASVAPIVDELDREVMEGVLIKYAASGLHILASPARPEAVEQVSAQQMVKIVDFLRRMYAYVVLDTSTYLNDLTVSMIDMADAIVLITTQDIPAIKNARIFLDLLHGLGIDRERVCFVMNRFDKRIPITPERVSQNLKQEVMAVLPLDERVVIPAINRGIPFMIDHKTQPIGRAMFALAEHIRRVVALEKDGDTRASGVTRR